MDVPYGQLDVLSMMVEFCARLENHINKYIDRWISCRQKLLVRTFMSAIFDFDFLPFFQTSRLRAVEERCWKKFDEKWPTEEVSGQKKIICNDLEKYLHVSDILRKILQILLINIY